MSTLSGLCDSVRAFLGRTLTMRLEYGWGWTLHTRGSSEAEPFRDIDAVNLTSVLVMPSEFFADGGASTRGFLGRIGLVEVEGFQLFQPLKELLVEQVFLHAQQ